jgi:hypothetical protein
MFPHSPIKQNRTIWIDQWFLWDDIDCRIPYLFRVHQEISSPISRYHFFLLSSSFQNSWGDPDFLIWVGFIKHHSLYSLSDARCDAGIVLLNRVADNCIRKAGLV